MVKFLTSFVVAFLFGIIVRAARFDCPAPPTLRGALLVVAVTLGYMMANWFLWRP